MVKKRILFICLGNICRSPMAEFIFKDMVHKNGLDDQFEIASAATGDEEHGNPLYPPARTMLQQHGIACEGHHARQTSIDDYRHFDLIVAMDDSNIRDLHRLTHGDPDKKISLLLDHTPTSDAKHHHRNIADPWFTHNFDDAFDDITTGCAALLEELTQ